MTRPKHGGNIVWASAIAGCSASFIKDFSASINPWGMPEMVIKAIEDGIPRLKNYPNPEYPFLKEALAKHHNIDREYIIPGNGSADLLTSTAKELAQGDRTYLITPAFGDYQRALNSFSGEIFKLNPQLPFGSLDSIIPDDIKANSNLLINNPHNPTGKLWTIGEIEPYLDKFSLVAIDEAFMDFLPPDKDQSIIPLVKKYPNLIILRSLTKFYSLPGLRIGYAISHPERILKWQSDRDPWSVNSLAVEGAIAALSDRDFQEKTYNWLPNARDNLFVEINNLPQFEAIESSVNFLLVKSKISVTKLQIELLKKERILIRDCLSFPELGDNYFRIAVRTPEENNSLIEALAKVCYF